MAEAPTKPSDQRPDHPVAAGQPLLAFVHIPRTGGGTVSSALKNYARPKSAGNVQKDPERTRRSVELIGSTFDRWQAVADHIPYGLYHQYLPADARYMTILREPVDRVLSHYHFHLLGKRRGEMKLRETWEGLMNLDRLERLHQAQSDASPSEIKVPEDALVSLEEGLARRVTIYDNLATRFLWGGRSIFGELPPDALERAKENVSRFWFVGFAERLDESVVLLGRQLGIGLMAYQRRHVSQKRPSLGETPDELRELIAEHNALDIELYRFARERFDQEAPPSEELAADVQELRSMSVAATEAGQNAREEQTAQRLQRRVEKHAVRAQPRRSASEGKPLLALVQVPATGERAVSSAISRNYAHQRKPGSTLKNPERTRGSLETIATSPWLCKAVGDYVAYGLYQRLLPDDTRYITVLRDPVERVLAQYNVQAAHPAGARNVKRVWELVLNNERIERGDAGEEEIVLADDEDFSLGAGLRRRICLYDNLMTRFLFGGESVYGELPHDALERAKANIAGFWFVGVGERLDDSIILLGRKLEIGLMPFNRKPETLLFPHPQDASAELLGQVAEHNALDVELHRFARERFEEEAPAPAELAAEAVELRRLSASVADEDEAFRVARTSRRTAQNASVEGANQKRPSGRQERAAAREERKEKQREPVRTRPPGPKRLKRAGAGTANEIEKGSDAEPPNEEREPVATPRAAGPKRLKRAGAGTANEIEKGSDPEPPNAEGEPVATSRAPGPKRLKRAGAGTANEIEKGVEPESPNGEQEALSPGEPAARTGRAT